MAHWSAPAALAERLIAFFGGEREATAGGGRDEAVANGESAGGEEGLGFKSRRWLPTEAVTIHEEVWPLRVLS